MIHGGEGTIPLNSISFPKPFSQVYIRIVKSTAYSPTFSLQSCSKKGENFSGVELDLVLYQISSSF